MPVAQPRSHRGQIAGVSLRVKRVITSDPRLARRRRKKNHLFAQVVFLCWRKPIFPGRLQPSIFGAGELNFRVRDGNGWTLAAINTNYSVCCLTGQLQYNTTAFENCKPFFKIFRKNFAAKAAGLEKRLSQIVLNRASATRGFLKPRSRAHLPYHTQPATADTGLEFHSE